jgi:hypothetical protein
MCAKYQYNSDSFREKNLDVETLMIGKLLIIVI